MTEQPSLRVELTLSRPPPAERELQAQVAADVSAIAGALGLEVTPTVDVRTADAAPRPVVIHINGARLRSDRMAEVQLEQVAADLGGGDTYLIARLVRDALTADPALLLSDQQVTRWCEHAGMAATASVISGLRAAVGQGRSVRDVPRIAGLLDEAVRLDPCHPGEALNGLLEPPPLVVRLAPDYLRALPAVPPDGLTEASVRESLGDSLGVPLPPLRIEQDPALHGTEIGIQINDLQVASFLGLRPLQSAVLSRPHQTVAGKPISRPIVFPGGQRGEALDAGAHDASASSSLLEWNPIEFILLGVQEAAARFAPRLLTRAHIVRQLDVMREVLPVLVEDAMSAGCAGELTQLSGQLLAELCPIRDLEAILQAYACWCISPGDFGGDLMATVRRALGIRLATAEMPRGVVTVYLLHPDIEAAAISTASEHRTDEREELADKLLAAIEAELAGSPVGDATPSLLTTATCRPAIRALIASELYRIRVLAFDEIPGDVLIEPVSRISTSAAD